MKANKRGLIGIAVSVAVLIIIISLFLFVGDTTPINDVTSFKTDVRSGTVTKVELVNDTLYVINKDGKADYKLFVRDGDIIEFLNDYNEMVYIRGYQQAFVDYINDSWGNLGTIQIKDIFDGNDINHPNDTVVITDGNGDSREEEIPKEVMQESAEAALKGASEYAKQYSVKISVNDRYTTSFWSLAIQFLPAILMILIGVVMIRMMLKSGNSALSFGKTSAHQTVNSKIRFKDVAGADEEKEELREIVEFLKSPAKFTGVGARIPKGVLMVGPPGTGKTLFAKAVAGEANVPFFSISGSDFVEMFVGVGASRVRDLFEQAKKNMPCIIFIDEIDAVGRQRGTGMGGGHDEREQTLNQLLVHMDGFVANEGIIVMAATNRADVLDPALLRPGRFDRQIYVHRPDVKGREAIFKVHSRNKPLEKDIEFRTLARLTSGFSGADIENLLNEAAILCARANRTTIVMNDIFEGINKVMLGPQKKSRLVTEVDKRNTAYHEAGHAIVARSLPDCDPVHEVSIIPRGHAAGYTMMRPDNDDNSYTVNKLNANIAMAMGGRAAEEIVIHDVSAGAAGDIKSVTNTARKMVTEWGMSSEVGPVFFGGSGEVFLGRDYTSHSSTSESMASKIDAEVYKIVEIGHKKALDILQEKRHILDNMARILVERETIYTEEVTMIMDGKSVDEVVDYIDKKLEAKSKKADAEHVVVINVLSGDNKPKMDDDEFGSLFGNKSSDTKDNELADKASDNNVDSDTSDGTLGDKTSDSKNSDGKNSDDTGSDNNNTVDKD